MSRAAIIIPHHNDETRLRKLLDSIRVALTGRTLNWQIVVVDDRSADPSLSRAVATACGVDFVAGDGRGSYAARNAGLRFVGTALGYLFTDSDCVFTPDTVAAYERWLLSDDPRLLAAGPITLFARMPATPTRWEVLDMAIGLPQERNVREQQVAVTASLCVRGVALERFGMFNETFRSGGDIEYTRRVGRESGGIAWLPDAGIFHPARATREEHLGKQRRVQRGILERELAGPHRSATFSRHLWETLRPPLGAWKRIVRVPRVSVGARLGAGIAMVEQKTARLGILLSCALGGTPKSIRPEISVAPSRHDPAA